MTFVLVSLGCLAVLDFVFAWALCRSAADGDEMARVALALYLERCEADKRMGGSFGRMLEDSKR